ncbi:cytochrome c peroxidase [Massilia sp. CCM 9210]|uniref:cytochrome-c peroxidase n=1 Tax=Massilia scottii TaxID=3057166 RepID=UPI002796AE10|nr:cytochrome c peroxidase [Massilia sp. CCM 9210]MDQ1814809.1 cytochrome c peroxidase [Massilia sp. CCM 9210]
MLSTLRRSLGRALAALASCWAGVAAAQALVNEPIRPLPMKAVGDPARIALGARLFQDLRFSRDSTHSCATCHQLRRGGADGKAISTGADGKPALFNTPTVYNSSFNFRQTWTGRYSGAEQLLDHVITRPKAFADSWDLMAERLAKDEALSAQFMEVYGDALRPAYVRDALDQFLRSLVTPSRFDRYLRGDAGAITAEEERGYLRFKSFGCAACHQGINVGGNLFQKMGAMREMPGLETSGADLGRYQETKRNVDRHVFRVPGLRNVALTAPYFHDGSVSTLDQAVELMFKYQLGRTASQQDKELIVRFLHTLSGEKLVPAAPPAAPPGVTP